jgi:hypothetical protein
MGLDSVTLLPLATGLESWPVFFKVAVLTMASTLLGYHP